MKRPLLTRLTILHITLLMSLTFYLSACGPATPTDISAKLARAKQIIREKSWREAADVVKNIDDDWTYVRAAYKPSDAHRFEELCLQLSLAVEGESPTSMSLWQKLSTTWKQMNLPPSAKVPSSI